MLKWLRLPGKPEGVCRWHKGLSLDFHFLVRRSNGSQPRPTKKTSTSEGKGCSACAMNV